MTEAGPLSRVARVDALSREGVSVTIEAAPGEREALAAFLELPAIAALTATFRLEPQERGGARVTGNVHGECTRICVVSLEPFEATVDEAVDVRFAPPAAPDSRPSAHRETVSLDDDDEPDPLIDGKIDLGVLAAEFFALGLDPYPRKPGVTFDPPPEPRDEEGPFAALRLGPKDGSASGSA